MLVLDGSTGWRIRFVRGGLGAAVVGRRTCCCVTVLLRRAYAAERIWAALTARSNGEGHRRIGVSLGVPAATVRGWLRRAAQRLEAMRALFLTVAVTAGVDVRIPDTFGCAWRDALAAVATATAAIRFRFGAAGLLGAVTPARVAAAASSGRLLAPGWPGLPDRGDATPVAPAAAHDDR
jgi:hypothetical protein